MLAVAWKPVTWPQQLSLPLEVTAPSDFRCLLHLVGICVYMCQGVKPVGYEIRSTKAAQARLVLSTVFEVFTNAILNSQPKKRLYHSCVLTVQ